MRPANYSEEDIIEVGCRLESKGKVVTGYALSMELGGGDKKRLINIWRAHKEKVAGNDGRAVELPIDVEELLSESIKNVVGQFRGIVYKINEVAVKSADIKVNEVLRRCKDLEEYNSAELNDAGELVDKLEQEVMKLTKERDDALNECEELKAKSIKDKAEIAALEARLSQMTSIEELISKLGLAGERS